MSTDDGLREAVEALAVEWWGRATEATRAPSWRQVAQDLRAALAEHPATPAEPELTPGERLLHEIFAEPDAEPPYAGALAALQDGRVIPGLPSRPEPDAGDADGLTEAEAEQRGAPAEPDGFYVKPSGTTNEPVVRDTP